MTLVMKFGGTSVGSAAAMRDTAQLIEQAREQWPNVVVVASAMGSKPVKVTDLLLNGAHAAFKGDPDVYRKVVEQVRHIHYETIDELLAPEGERQLIMAEIDRFLERYADLCAAVYVLGELTPRALDAIGGMGEQMSVRVLAAYLRQTGRPAEAIDATELIVTDERFQAATPLHEATRRKTAGRLQPLFRSNVVPVVTGFIGATLEGVTTTLGRGGSDFSAAILGQALDAGEVWIWTDVDGVLTADPRIVPHARSIAELTYREVSELAYYGARVLHPKTMRPCIESGIPLRIKNTFNPAHPGTVIVEDDAGEGGLLKAVTAIDGVSMITVEGKGMIGVPGIAARTFGSVAARDVSVLLISQASSEQSICFIVPEESVATVIEGLEIEFAVELARRDIERVWPLQDVAIITIVGAGIIRTAGIAGRVFSALGDNGINIIAIAQGSSECGISVVVGDDEMATAVNHIHGLIGEGV